MGNLTHQTDVTGKVTEYHYDLADNIREVWDNGKKIAEYAYNADNTIKYLKNGSLYTEYAYDADRNLIGLKTLLGTDTIVDNRYTYNGNGDRLEKYQKCGTTKYSYDKMRRLAKVEYPNATEELFYDKAGNRTKRLYNGTEELYQYDKRNRLTAYTKGSVTSQYEYDNAGNLLKDDKAQYTYDAFNRNTKVETFNGNIQINRYDAEGLRHEMEENGKLVSFIYRGDEVIAEESQEDKIRYIRTSVLLASDAESARTYYHYASDEMGSITHVVDENEEILNHYEYDAWGNLTVCEEKVHNRFKFNGQQYDPISQQYYLRARYYNPVIGRFTQEDSYNADGLNLYVYCRNNPVSYVDPSGNICEKVANRIRQKLINGDPVSRSEYKKLAAYDRHQLDLQKQQFNNATATNKQKGNFGEMCADYYIRYDKKIINQGYLLVPIGRDAPTGLNDKIVKGIDGVYINRGAASRERYVINETKYNTAQLGNTKRDGQQMSYTWLMNNRNSNRDRISKSVSNQNDVTQIHNGLMNSNDVLLIETRVDTNGEVTSTKLTTTPNSGTVQNAGAWP